MAGIDNNTILYLRGDSFTDLSLKPKTITNNGSEIVTDNGYKCFNIVNNSKYLKLTGLSNYNFNGDFTIEFCSNITTENGRDNHFISSFSEAAYNRFAIAYNSTSDRIAFFGHSGGTAYNYDSSSTYSNFNAMHHVAIVRKDSSIKIYVDGVNDTNANTDIKNGAIRLYSDVFIGKANFGDTNHVGFTGKMNNIRISNIARYTDNFNPPIRPFNSININIINQTKDKIDFTVSKLGQEVVNKIEVLVNGQVYKTYTSIGDLTYNIDKSLLLNGNNKIKIKVTFDNDYTEEKEFNYEYKIDNLTTSSSLKELIDRQEVLTNVIEVQKNTLKSILESKNIEVADSENKLSILIDKVNKFENIKLKTYIYKDGYINIDLIEGFVDLNYTGTWYLPIVKTQFNSDNIQINITANPYGYCSFGSKNKINLSNYNTFKIEFEIFNASDNADGVPLRFGFEDDDLGALASFVVSESVNVIGKKTLELDISSINDSLYLKVCSALRSKTNNLKIYKMWLE